MICTKSKNAWLPMCEGRAVGQLKFIICKISKTKTKELSVRFQLIVPCTLSSTEQTFVTFLGLRKNEPTPTVTAAKDVKVDFNIISGKVLLIPEQTYQVVSYTFNPNEPLRFTAGAVNELISLPDCATAQKLLNVKDESSKVKHNKETKKQDVVAKLEKKNNL